MHTNLQQITEANDAIISKIFERVSTLYYNSTPKKKSKRTLESIIKQTHSEWASVAFADALRIANGDSILELNTKIIDKYFESIK